MFLFSLRIHEEAELMMLVTVRTVGCFQKEMGNVVTLFSRDSLSRTAEERKGMKEDETFN